MATADRRSFATSWLRLHAVHDVVTEHGGMANRVLVARLHSPLGWAETVANCSGMPCHAPDRRHSRLCPPGGEWTTSPRHAGPLLGCGAGRRRRDADPD